MDYVSRLLAELLENVEKYFDKNLTLNSEGRKVLEKVIAILMNNSFECKRLVKKVRKKPTLENVVKLAETILGGEVAKHLRHLHSDYSLHRDSQQ